MTTREADEAGFDALWAAAIDCAQLGVWDADLVGNTCFYSPSWKRMLGYADDELESHPDLWLDLIHPERVADAASIEVLAACGIGFGQGFFLHRPEPLAELLAQPAPFAAMRA